MKRNKRAEAKNWFIQAKAEFEDGVELEKRKRFYLALFLWSFLTSPGSVKKLGDWQEVL